MTSKPAARDGDARFHVSQGTRASRAAAVIGLLLLAGLATLPAWGPPGTMKLLIEFLTLLALAQMWNLLAGYAGLISIGQQAYIGLGAYGLFICADRLGLHPLLAIVLVALVVAVVALGTALFAFRLRGGYFAIGTWVIAEVFRLLVSGSKEVGAGSGVTIQGLGFLGPQARLALTYWLALAVGFGSIALLAWIMRSRLGLALRAVRDSEEGAQSLGVDVLRTKKLVWVIAAVGCAVAGAVIYMNLLRIQPTAAFSVEWTARMIFIVIIGGLGRIEGPIVGALVYFALRETLSDFGSLYLMVLGIVAVAVTLLAPQGLWGLFVARFPVTLFGAHPRLEVLVADDGGPPATSHEEKR
ncbi:MAG: branched-chain amino acid ABC transporter permease [Aeromicrobium sp.]